MKMWDIYQYDRKKMACHALFLLLCTFFLCLLSYLDLHSTEMHTDFNAFYKSSQALINNENPYQFYNYNPPIFLLIFKPFVYFNQHTAFLLWTCCMGFFFFTASKVCLKVFVKNKKKRQLYALVLFTSFPFINNFLIGQITGLIFFILIKGYQSLINNHKKSCSLFWALATAIKFFPGLLFFFLIKRKYYQTAFYYSLFTIAFICLPLAFFKLEIYKNYLTSMNEIRWFSHSWNFSLFALPLKLLLKKTSTLNDMLFLRKVALSLSVLTTLIYLKILFTKPLKLQQQFNLSICFMLLISPLSWLYYLPLMFMPICFLLDKSSKLTAKLQISLLLSIIILCFPVADDFLPRAHYSWPLVLLFYCPPTLALSLLAYACQITANKSAQIVQKNTTTFYAFVIIMTLVLTHSNLIFIQFIVKILFYS